MTSARAQRFACGPLEIEIVSESERAERKIRETLELYNVAWPEAHKVVRVHVVETGTAAPTGAGAYLKCARMHVDIIGEGELRATFLSGAVATGNPAQGTWSVSLPPGEEFWTLVDLESLVSLILTEGWRNAGWTPLHAGTIVRDGICAVICAGSGGGKTSLTAAMIRRGWQTLGDDKLLLRLESGVPDLRGVVHTFNLHPRTRGWFPEVGDLEQLDRYSEWTEKRKVKPDDIWLDATRDRGTPTHLIALTRNLTGRDVAVEGMSRGDVLSTLLHQTVVPSDKAAARPILATVAATADRLRGFTVDLGDDVYANPECLASIEEALS